MRASCKSQRCIMVVGDGLTKASCPPPPQLPLPEFRFIFIVLLLGDDWETVSFHKSLFLRVFVFGFSEFTQVIFSYCGHTHDRGLRISFEHSLTCMSVMLLNSASFRIYTCLKKINKSS